MGCSWGLCWREDLEKQRPNGAGVFRAGGSEIHYACSIMEVDQPVQANSIPVYSILS